MQKLGEFFLEDESAIIDHGWLLILENDIVPSGLDSPTE